MMLFTRHTGRLVEFSKVDTLEKLVVVNQKNSCVTQLLHTLLHTITLLLSLLPQTTQHWRALWAVYVYLVYLYLVYLEIEGRVGVWAF